MWILFAIGSAFFAGITSILAKCGIKKTDSTVATAIRTIIVLIFSCIMVFISGSLPTIKTLDAITWVFLVLSGLATGASWLFYFRALQLGDVGKVVPVDKSSTVLTILLAFIFLRETVGVFSVIGVIMIAIGTFLMLDRKESIQKKQNGSSRWLLYALLAAFFASLTAILGKLGIRGVESNLGTAIRTAVVLVMAWAMVPLTKKGGQLSSVRGNELLFICLSGVTTGASWLCYYRALHDGPASIVVPIDKLSLLVTVLFSRLVFSERLTRRASIGLVIITVGTLLMTLA